MARGDVAPYRACSAARRSARGGRDVFQVQPRKGRARARGAAVGRCGALSQFPKYSPEVQLRCAAARPAPDGSGRAFPRMYDRPVARADLSAARAPRTFRGADDRRSAGPTSAVALYARDPSLGLEANQGSARRPGGAVAESPAREQSRRDLEQARGEAASRTARQVEHRKKRGRTRNRTGRAAKTSCFGATRKPLRGLLPLEQPAQAHVPGRRASAASKSFSSAHGRHRSLTGTGGGRRKGVDTTGRDFVDARVLIGGVLCTVAQQAEPRHPSRASASGSVVLWLATGVRPVETDYTDIFAQSEIARTSLLALASARFYPCGHDRAKARAIKRQLQRRSQRTCDQG